MEQWRDVPGYEGLYQVSNRGRVKWIGPKGRCRRPPDGILKPHPDRGYLYVSLFKRNAGPVKDTLWGVGVHRLVALAFIGPVPAWHEVNHIDNNPSNNTPENLEYVTHSENMKHAYRTGRHSVTGTKNPKVRLTEEDVRIIRQMHDYGISNTNIARAFDHSRGGIHGIVTGLRWKHLPYQPHSS